MTIKQSLKFLYSFGHSLLNQPRMMLTSRHSFKVTRSVIVSDSVQVVNYPINREWFLMVLLPYENMLHYHTAFCCSWMFRIFDIDITLFINLPTPVIIENATPLTFGTVARLVLMVQYSPTISAILFNRFFRLAIAVSTYLTSIVARLTTNFTRVLMLLPPKPSSIYTCTILLMALFAYLATVRARFTANGTGMFPTFVVKFLLCEHRFISLRHTLLYHNSLDIAREYV